jgi:hypothetical protein
VGVNRARDEKTVSAPSWTCSRRVSRVRYLAALAGTCLGGLKSENDDVWGGLNFSATSAELSKPATDSLELQGGLHMSCNH